MIFYRENAIHKKEIASKEVAKERLKGILMRDRVDISSAVLDTVKGEILSVAREYFSVQEKSTEVYLTNMKRNSEGTDENVLVALIPIVKSIKKEEEFILD